MSCKFDSQDCHEIGSVDLQNHIDLRKSEKRKTLFALEGPNRECPVIGWCDHTRSRDACMEYITLSVCSQYELKNLSEEYEIIELKHLLDYPLIPPKHLFYSLGDTRSWLVLHPT